MKTPFDWFLSDTANAAKEALRTAADTAAGITESAGTAANDAFGFAAKGLDDARKLAVDAASNAANAVGGTVNNAVSAVSQGVEDQRRKAEEARRLELDEAESLRQSNIAKLPDPKTLEIVAMLGDSPVPTTDDNIRRIKECFPIPAEQHVLWADAEFDLRPSGIVATDKGVFIKSDAVVFSNPFDRDSEENRTSSLYLIAWEYFDPECFTLDGSGNYALAVDNECSHRFVDACRRLCEVEPLSTASYEVQASYEANATRDMAATIGAAAVIESEIAVFAEQKAQVNNPGGHGEMAEEANTILDRFLGRDAQVVGRDNAKDGADRLVDGVQIQTKYYNTARGTLESTFDHDTGLYRYLDRAGNPMQLEVPKDQYDRVLAGFKEKIKQGKVPGVTDPAEAEGIVRRGHLTHKQAVNLTKPGTVESLAYDAATGAVVCSCAFGISFVAATYNAYRKTGDLEKSVEAGVAAGVQVFGVSFVQHILVSQIARTGAANVLMSPSQFVVEKLGYKATQALVNSIRTLSGKSAISGAAASKQLAKILRSNVITTAITLAVFSVPETYNLANRRISSAQYAKNMAALTGSVIGGAGGAVAAGAAAAKVAGAVGTGVAPGVGTAIGIVGGFVGGAAASAAVNTVGNVLHEGDAATIGRLLNAYVSALAVEYMLDEGELNALSEELDKIQPDDFKKLFADFLQADEQEKVLREFLEPHFEAVIARRAPFVLPGDDCIDAALGDMLISMN